MCAALESEKNTLRPGRQVAFWEGERVPGLLVWAGFARRESLGWWKKRGGKFVDVPAEKFAERSEATGKLQWENVPPGLVVRGLVDPNDGLPLLKIVTRDATVEEEARFRHSRMPVIEPPLFSAEPPPGLVPPPQMELPLG